jgi:hypothetical protein
MLAAFLIMVCVQDKPCQALAMPYETLIDCQAGIADLTATWADQMEKWSIPKMHCESKPKQT